MAVNDKILASDYNSLYDRLNAMRSKVKLSTISYTKAVAGETLASSSGMKNFKTDFDKTKTQNKYLKNASTYNPGNTIDVGQKILYTNLTLAQASLSSMESVCLHDAVHSTNSTNGTFSNFGVNGTFSNFSAFGDFGDRGTCSTNSTCSDNRINAVNDNFSTGNSNNTQFMSG